MRRREGKGKGKRIKSSGRRARARYAEVITATNFRRAAGGQDERPVLVSAVHDRENIT